MTFNIIKPIRFVFSIILLKFQLFQIIKAIGETHSSVVIQMTFDPADKKDHVFASNSLDLYLPFKKNS